MQLLIELHKFSEILYLDEPHEYILNGNKLTSVTTVKKKYSGFRGDYWKYKKALELLGHMVKSDLSKNVETNHLLIDEELVHYEQVPFVYDIAGAVKHISKEWSRKATIGNCAGSMVHKFLEDRFQGKKFPIIPPCGADIYSEEDFQIKVKTLIQYAKNFFNDHRHLLPIKCELVLFDEEYGVAGQVDLLAYNIITKELILIDYKTDKAFNTYSKFGTTLQAPFEHLHDCEMINYSLQTHMYKHILEKNTTCKVDKIMVVWFNAEQDNYKIIEAKDLSKEAIQILKLNEHSSKQYISSKKLN